MDPPPLPALPSSLLPPPSSLLARMNFYLFPSNTSSKKRTIDPLKRLSCGANQRVAFSKITEQLDLKRKSGCSTHWRRHASHHRNAYHVRARQAVPSYQRTAISPHTSPLPAFSLR